MPSQRISEAGPCACRISQQGRPQAAPQVLPVAINSVHSRLSRGEIHLAPGSRVAGVWLAGVGATDTPRMTTDLYQ